MNKPYIVCHMMTSVDGRIDCAMTEHLPGVQEYYDTLNALDAPTRISGRVTAELEMALPGKFEAKTAEALGKEAFSKAADAEGYEIVVDTHGTLLWGESAEDERPLLILTSEQVSKEYLAYLNGKHISWIACGKEHVDLKRACEILAAELDIKRAAVVGGGHINAGFLAAGLLDEVSILIGAGIDGRGGMQSVFDGLPMERGVTPLKLTSVRQYGSGAVCPAFASVACWSPLCDASSACCVSASVVCVSASDFFKLAMPDDVYHCFIAPVSVVSSIVFKLASEPTACSYAFCTSS